MSEIYRKIYQSLYGNNHNRELIHDLLLKSKKRSPVIYDIGCGYGIHFNTYLKFSKTIYAADSEISCLNYCRKKYPSIQCEVSIGSNWPSSDYVFFNFHVINYLSESELIDILMRTHNNMSGQSCIVADFLDADKLAFGTSEKVIHLNIDSKPIVFVNSLDYSEGENTLFREAVFDGDVLLYERQNTLKIWSIENLKKCFSASGLRIQEFKIKSMPNKKATFIEVRVS